MTRFVNFINNNTIMNSFVLALIKSLLIMAPLAIGLFSYPYMGVGFCRALFLYSVPLAFDLCIRIDQLKKSNESDGLLFAAVLMLFFISIFLIFVGFVGVFNNRFFSEYLPFIINRPWIVYVGVCSQSIWYFIEAVAFLIIIVLKKYTKKTAVKITEDEQANEHKENEYKANEYNI